MESGWGNNWMEWSICVAKLENEEECGKNE